MNQNEPYPNQYNDEISLVDLAKTFVKRRRVFYVVFALCFLAGVAFALVQEDRYEYRSLIQLAQDDEGKPLESSKSVIAALENRWLPEYEASYQAENDEEFRLKITFSNPENTSLIGISTEATEQNSEAVKRAHETLIEQVMSRQSRLTAKQQTSLKRQIESISNTVEMLQDGEDTGAAIAEAIRSKTALESELEGIVASEVLVSSRQGADNVGTSKLVIMLLATILGFMAGVFMAFISEFIALVREQLVEEQS